MNWSAYVLDLHLKGYTVEQIVDMANHPIITPKYVDNVLAVERAKVRKHGYVDGFKYRTPRSPERKIIKEYYDKIGEEAFMREFREIKSTALGKKLGVNPVTIRNFVLVYVRGTYAPKHNLKYANYYERLIREGRMEPPEKEKTINDILDLW